MSTELWVECRRAPYALWRALAATILIMTGAVSAHTWAGGSVPTLPGLALLSAVVFVSGAAVLRRSTAIALLLPAVAVAQWGLHQTFGLVGEHSHQVASIEVTGWTWRMVLAHVGVTLLTGLLWWAGQRAGIVIVRLLTRAAEPALGLMQSRPITAHASQSREAFLTISPRRGPPQAICLT